MESYESKHSDHSFTGRLATRLAVTRPPLRIDSQAKYGESLPHDLCRNLGGLCELHREACAAGSPGCAAVQLGDALLPPPRLNGRARACFAHAQ